MKTKAVVKMFGESQVEYVRVTLLQGRRRIGQREFRVEHYDDVESFVANAKTYATARGTIAELDDQLYPPDAS